MKDTTIIELGKIKLKNGIMLTGLPGIGLIGRVVGRYLVEELKAKKVADMYSPHFPHQVIMTKKRSPLTPGFLFSYHEILKNEGNDTPITDWNEEINIGNLLKSADEKIVIIFKKNYFIKSHDIVKIIELVNSLRTSNISAEFYIENMSVKSLLSDMDIKSIANIRIH